ncbi:MAG: SdpI family protein [Methanomassiliicoccaceae archaeon]|jgi:uncharacterized membrane protein|nr:SdpI family protein [Methanomassiliicoccaceae archaeon]
MDVLEIVYIFTVLSMGVIFTVLGWVLYKKPPSKINSVYGYRTPRSMSDQKLWDFSQRYSGKLMAYVGIISIVASLFVWMAFPITLTVFLVMTFFPVAAMLPVLLITESKMKKMQ